MAPGASDVWVPVPGFQAGQPRRGGGSLRGRSICCSFFSRMSNSCSSISFPTLSRCLCHALNYPRKGAGGVPPVSPWLQLPSRAHGPGQGGHEEVPGPSRRRHQRSQRSQQCSGRGTGRGVGHGVGHRGAPGGRQAAKPPPALPFSLTWGRTGEDFCSIQHRDPRLILPWVQRRAVLSSARPAPGLQPLAGGSSGRPRVLRTRPGRERRSPATWEAQKCGTAARAGSLPFPIRRTKPAVVWSRVSMAEICFLCVKCFFFFLLIPSLLLLLKQAQSFGLGDCRDNVFLQTKPPLQNIWAWQLRILAKKTNTHCQHNRPQQLWGRATPSWPLALVTAEEPLCHHAGLCQLCAALGTGTGQRDEGTAGLELSLVQAFIGWHLAPH